MKSKGMLLKGVAIVLTLYFAASIPYFLIEGDASLEGHPIIAALYLLFVAVHEVLVLLAVLCQWAGVLNNKRGLVNLAILFMILAAVELVILVYPALVLLVLVILNLFARMPKTISQ